MINPVRHCLWLAALVTVLAVFDPASAVRGPLIKAALYGLLYSMVLLFSLRNPVAWRRGLGFVALGSGLSCLAVAVAWLASRLEFGLPGVAKPAVLLTVAAGLGALTYAALVRGWLGLRLAPDDWVRIALGCAAADLAVLGSGVYRYGGSLWFAAAWWVALSGGLLVCDRRCEGRTADGVPLR